MGMGSRREVRGTTQTAVLDVAHESTDRYSNDSHAEMTFIDSLMIR